MRANSIGSEVYVKINFKELKELEIKPLEGRIKFSDNAGSSKREIFLALNIRENKKNFWL